MAEPEQMPRSGQFLGAIAGAAGKRPALACVVAFLLALGLGLGARNLRINPDLSELLPESFPSVQNLQSLRTKVGGIGYLTVVASGRPEAELRDFADHISPELEKLEKVRYVNYRRPVDFFDERALYFVDVVDLSEMQRRLGEREKYERLQANPLFVDLDEAEPPELDFSDLREKYELDEQASADSHYYDGKRKRIILFIKPTELASDLQFAKELVDEVTEVLQSKGAGIRFELSGRYKKRIDMQSVIRGDLQWASLIAVALMLGYLGLHFRSLRLVVSVFCPLVVGLLWTYGFAGWVLGTLNILTAFVGAILLGVGIDVGIHLVDRIIEEKNREGALRRAFASSGRAATIATFTTVFGFASLALSEFRVFREFGILASAGLLFVLLSYLILLPVLLRGYEPKVGAGSREKAGEVPAARVMRQAPWAFWLPFWGLVALVLWVGAASFNYNFAALDPSDLRSYQIDQEINQYLGHSQTPLVVQTESEAQARAAAKVLRDRKKANPSSGIDKVSFGYELVPELQQEKEEILASISETLELIDKEELTDEERKDLEDLQRRAAAKPFRYEDLPDIVRRAFATTDGDANLVLVLPGVSLSDGASIRLLADELREIPLPTGNKNSAAEISATGEAMVLADVLDSVFREAPRSFAVAALVILSLLWMFLGSLQRSLLCLAPAVATLAATLGLLGLTGLSLNYLNIIILPVLLGISVDGATHLLHRTLEEKDPELALARSGPSIVGAIATTAMGFFALLAVRHPGLRSIGSLALLGLGANLLITYLVLPAALALWSKAGRFSRGGGARTLHLTVLRAGYAGKGPGTLGAVFALPLAYLFQGSPWWAWTVGLGAWTALSILHSNRYIREGDGVIKDPQEIVVDETLGCLIALAFVPWEWPWAIAAFVGFRLFDILKPGPVGWIDRKVAEGAGVILDDVVAGLMAGAGLLALRLWLFT